MSVGRPVCCRRLVAQPGDNGVQREVTPIAVLLINPHIALFYAHSLRLGVKKTQTF